MLTGAVLKNNRKALFLVALYPLDLLAGDFIIKNNSQPLSTLLGTQAPGAASSRCTLKGKVVQNVGPHSGIREIGFGFSFELDSTMGSKRWPAKYGLDMRVDFGTRKRKKKKTSNEHSKDESSVRNEKARARSQEELWKLILRDPNLVLDIAY
ncbi:hypothetical protein B0H14DRAFT_2630626 [Mycena olivaceomarginata]|nr:hypothetical protein B0H14DRAFT_2630626 [Mycena olivaceomarginata]